MHHYSGSTVSAPTRCITLTGLHSGRAYIRGNDEMGSRGDVWSHSAMLADSSLEGQRPLLEGTVTYPLLLQKAGYTTACVGKWGLGYPGSEGAPNKMGFDFFYGYNCQRQAHTFYPPFLYLNDKRVYLPNELLPPGTRLDEGADPYDINSYAKFSQQVNSCEPMYEEIIKFVEQNKDRPRRKDRENPNQVYNIIVGNEKGQAYGVPQICRERKKSKIGYGHANTAARHFLPEIEQSFQHHATIKKTRLYLR